MTNECGGRSRIGGSEFFEIYSGVVLGTGGAIPMEIKRLRHALRGDPLAQLDRLATRSAKYDHAGVATTAPE